MPSKNTFIVSLADKQSIIVPNDIAQYYHKGSKTRVQVKAISHNKSIAFHAELRYQKTGLFKIYFSKNKQKELSISIGDNFKIELSEDTSKYGVIPCEEFEAVMLSDYEAYEIFETLTPGKKRSIIYAINRFKSSQMRIDKTIVFTNNLKRGIFDQRLWLKEN